jgi:hypothetical protein
MNDSLGAERAIVLKFILQEDRDETAEEVGL